MYTQLKPIEFCGQSLDVIRQFPEQARREIGHQLDRLQRGLDPLDWRPMNGVGKGSREIRVRKHGQYRVIYTAVQAESVYVLHAFQKKTRKTRQQDIELAKQAWKRVNQKRD